MPEDCLGADNAPYPIGGFKDCYLFTQEETVQAVTDAIDAVVNIQTQSVEIYRDISNATNPQPAQMLHVVSYDEVISPNGTETDATGSPVASNNDEIAYVH